MAVILDIIAEIWQHDYDALADTSNVRVVYYATFAKQFLEKG